MRYLAQKYSVADQWYPKDLIARAKVDTYLDWHHLNIRRPSMTLVFGKVLGPRIGVKVQSDFNQIEKELHLGLKGLNNVFLAETEYLAGSKPSIADLSAICELQQLRLMSYDFSKYPKVSEWIERMEKMDGFQDVHSFLFRVKAKL